MKLLDDVIDQVAYAKLLEKLKRQLADGYRKGASNIGAVVTETNYSSAGLGFDRTRESAVKTDRGSAREARRSDPLLFPRGTALPAVGDGGLASAAGFTLGHRRGASSSSGYGLSSGAGSAAATRSASPLPGGEGSTPPPLPSGSTPAVAQPRTLAAALSSSLESAATEAAETASVTGIGGPGRGMGTRAQSIRSALDDLDDAASYVDTSAMMARTLAQLDRAMQTLHELQAKGTDFYLELSDFLDAFRGLVSAERRADVELLEQQRADELEQFLRRWEEAQTRVVNATEDEAALREGYAACDGTPPAVCCGPTHAAGPRVDSRIYGADVPRSWSCRSCSRRCTWRSRRRRPSGARCSGSCGWRSRSRRPTPRPPRPPCRRPWPAWTGAWPRSASRTVTPSRAAAPTPVG